jgi:hypothetical protein
LTQSISLSQAINYNTQALRLQIGTLQKQVTEAQTDLSSQIVSLAQISLSQEDRECFSWDREGRFIPLPTSRAFTDCLGVYIDRATKYAISSLVSAPDAAMPPSTNAGSQVFPYADNYNELRLIVDPGQKEYPETLANPKVWYSSADLLVSLVDHSPDDLSLIQVALNGNQITSTEIDPVIEKGQQLDRFITTVALIQQADGSHLRMEPFQDLVKQMLDARQDELKQISGQVENPGVNADVTLSINQAPQMDYDYGFLKPNTIGLCDGPAQDVSLGTVLAISDTIPGGHSGSDGIVAKSAIPSLVPQIVADLQQYGFNQAHARMPFDKSLVGAMDPVIPLAEQIKFQNASVHICIKSVAISNLNFVFPKSSEEDLGIHLLVYVNMESSPYDANHGNGSSGVEDLLVQELALQKHVQFQFTPLYWAGHMSGRTAVLLIFPWPQLEGNFASYFEPVPSAEANANLDTLKKGMSSYLSSVDTNLDAGLKSSLLPDDQRFERAKSSLLRLSSIGLNQNEPLVRQWLQLLSTSDDLMSTGDQIDAIMTNKQSITEATKNFSDVTVALTQALAQLATARDLAPSTSMIDSQLMELSKIKTLAAGAAF